MANYSALQFRVIVLLKITVFAAIAHRHLKITFPVCGGNTTSKIAFIAVSVVRGEETSYVFTHLPAALF